MRKLVKFIIILLIIAAALYLGSDFLFEKASEQAVKFLPGIISRYGIEVKQPFFRTADIVSLNAVAWQDVSAEVGRVERLHTYLSGQKFSLKAKRIELFVRNPFRLAFLVSIKGLDIFRLDEYGRSFITDRVYGEKVKFLFQLDSLTKEGLSSVFRSIFKDLFGLIKEGRCSMPVEFDGKITLSVRGFFVEGRVYTKREGSETVLFMNKEDLRRIAQDIKEEELTEGDIGMLSRSPIRMPRLLQIRDKARDTAGLAHARNPAVPEDAYRHVLWSYLLTKEYGPEFAEKVTNAHEIGSDNTWHERQMDYNNNAVGRRYARRGYSEDSILGRVVSDPNVIRSAR